MKIKIALLGLLVVLATSGVSAATVHVKHIWCENSGSYTTAFFVFDDNGHLLRASGIDCLGNAWTKEFCSSGPGVGDPTVWIASLSADKVEVAASQATSFQIIDMSGSTLPTIGDSYNIIDPNVPVLVDITDLPVGTYGVATVQNNCVTHIDVFDKR
jgi:hypothetical protein